MNVPFGDIDRVTDISSPFEQLPNGTLFTDSASKGPAELRARVCTLAVQNPTWLILDEPNRELPRPLRCAIIGTSKQHKNNQPRHYALVLSLLGTEGGGDVCERVGVAYLTTEEILSQEKQEYVRIR